MDYQDTKETDYGYVLKVSGPLVVGAQLSGAQMYELVRVGKEEDMYIYNIY